MPDPDDTEIAALRAELVAARAELGRLREQLSLVQRYGRLGCWERDITTGQAHWDATTRRIWGLPETAAAPSTREMLAMVVDADRETVRRYVEQSLCKPGAYAIRFRLRTPAGQVRHAHSNWEVLDGPDGQPQRLVGVVIDETDPLAGDGTAAPLQSQLALAVELGDILIWRHDLAAGRLHWNLSGWRTLGMEPRPEGLTVDEVRTLVHPDDLPRVVASAEQALASGQPVDLEARYRHTDGSWRVLLLRRSVLRGADGTATAFLGIALDLTERRAQARRAEAMSRRFEAVTRTAGIGYWVNDLSRQRIEWNSEIYRIHGMKPDEPPLDTRAWLEGWVHPEDRATVQRAIIERLQVQGERGLDVPLRIVRRNGEVRQLASHTRLERGEDGELVFGVLIDVTDRLRSEFELRGAEARIALALRGAGIGTWEIDLETRQTRWDTQMWRLRGLVPEREAPSLERLHGWVHPEDRESVMARYLASERSGEPLDQAFRVVWPDGSVHWLASRASEVTDADGRRRRIGVNWDVTAARQAEHARQEAELARRESQAKSQFLARMSHELRTPLNAVLGFTQLMLGDEHGQDAASAQRRQRLEHVGTAGSHLLQLIDDVLTLAAVQGGEQRFQLQAAALGPLVQEVLAMLAEPAAARGITLQADPRGLAVQADPTRLRQVLLNLVGNAIKYGRDGGRATIDATREGDEIHLRISDNGPGLTAEQLPHLFEPFNRLGAEGSGVQGHGMGLAIVKALVERMGGRVWAESRLGEGSCFQVALPAADTRELHVPAPAPAAQAAGGHDIVQAAAAGASRHRILYIEDNPVNALIIRELLANRSDIELHEATEGLPGLEAARRLQPALVLLDMQLPDIDGQELLRALKADAVTAAIPVIVLSANAMAEDIARALQAGARAYWTKPLDFDVFRAGLDAVLAGAPANA